MAEMIVMKRGFLLTCSARKCEVMRSKSHRRKVNILCIKGTARALMISIKSQLIEQIFVEILLFLPLGTCVDKSYGLCKLLKEVKKRPDLHYLFSK